MRLSVVLLGMMALAYASYAQSPADTLQFSEGIQVVWFKAGKGALPVKGQSLLISYVAGIYPDEIVDQSTEEGLVVKPGTDSLITAWNELLPAMRKGSSMKAWVKSKKAYGKEGQRDPGNYERFIVPPDTDMWFEITVLGIR